ARAAYVASPVQHVTRQFRTPRGDHPRPPDQRADIDRMDAKQVWRPALGELHVSLSAANFETWLRDTALAGVDDNRFRISVPNGFAKDWLETRYRSLISQTLARIVGYSVQVEFFVGPGYPATDVAPADEAAAGSGGSGGSTPQPAAQAHVASPQVRLESTRVGGEGGASNINPRSTLSNFIVGSR